MCDDCKECGICECSEKEKVTTAEFIAGLTACMEDSGGENVVISVSMDNAERMVIHIQMTNNGIEITDAKRTIWR